MMKFIGLLLLMISAPLLAANSPAPGFLFHAPMFQKTLGISNTVITRIRIDSKDLARSKYTVYKFKDMPDKKTKSIATTLATKAHFAIKNKNKGPITLSGFLPYSSADTIRHGISAPISITAKLDATDVPLTRNRSDCKGNCKGYSFKITIAPNAVSLLVFDAEHQILEGNEWFKFEFFGSIKGRPSYRRLGCDKCYVEFEFATKKIEEEESGKEYQMVLKNGYLSYESEFSLDNPQISTNLTKQKGDHYLAVSLTPL